MKLRLLRGGAETAERDAERHPSLRLSQRSLRLRGEFPSKRGSYFLRFLRPHWVPFVEAIALRWRFRPVSTKKHESFRVAQSLMSDGQRIGGANETRPPRCSQLNQVHPEPLWTDEEGLGSRRRKSLSPRPPHEERENSAVSSRSLTASGARHKLQYRMSR